MNNKVLTIIIILFLSFSLWAQEEAETIRKGFPFAIGNIAFAIDSIEIPVGNIKQGSEFNISIPIKNIGKEVVSLVDSKSGKFVELSYDLNTLKPQETAILFVKFNAVKEFPEGEINVEVGLVTNDIINPYKFIYLVTNIIEDNSSSDEIGIIDSVPRLIFDHYNYDFGHMKRGRTLYHAFLFTNMGAQELIIENIVATPGCKIVGFPQETVQSLENGSLIVKIRFLANYGVQHHTITLITNDPTSPELVLSIHGSVYKKSPTKRNPDFCIQ